ncbi:MAG: PQQ-binding-like beta-propeller repeat protein [Verrucomicrobiales bacterium]
MKKSNQLLFSTAVISSVLFSHSVIGDDWPQWRGKDRTGISRETGWMKDWPDEGPKQLWRNKIGIGWSSVSVADGRVFTMGNIDEVDYVYAFDAVNGKPAWSYKYPCSSKDPNGYPGTRCTPTVDGDRVYTVSREGHFFCFNAKTGEKIWSKDFKRDFGASVPTWGFSGSPLIEGELVIVETGASGSSVVAMDKKSGEVVWKSGKDGAGYGSPVAFDFKGNRAVAIFSAYGIHGFNIKNGQELFRHPWKTSYDVNAATPVVAGETIFISSGYGKGCALINISSGKPEALWENKNMRNQMNSCVLWEGHLFGFDESELKCLDYKTGKVKWSDRSFGKGSLIVADGHLIIFSDKGELSLAKADAASFERLESFQALGGRDTWQLPAIANGIIYARTRDAIAAFDVRGNTDKSSSTVTSKKDQGFIPLFPDEGQPKGWDFRAWDDVKNPGPEGAVWRVKEGVLNGGEPRLTWLVSEKEYSDFVLKFEWKLGERGNGGVGLRFPGFGDPAFDGLELQMVDPRYYPADMTVPPNELTGSLYRAVAPMEQLYKPSEWNSYEITCKGPQVKVVLNGKQVLDVNLDEQNQMIKRHNGGDAVPLKDRPRKGHIGFQDLSRGGSHVQIRNAMIKEL